MDAIDRKILAELQGAGRLTVTELAERVALSVAPCHRRLRELERTKVIRGYRAIIDPAAIGLGFEVLVQVTMDREDATTIAGFERELAGIPEVRHAERLFGDPDYLIRVATADLAAYQALRDQKLAALPGVQRLSSTIVMKRIVEDRPYPVGPGVRRLARGAMIFVARDPDAWPALYGIGGGRGGIAAARWYAPDQDAWFGLIEPPPFGLLTPVVATT